MLPLIAMILLPDRAQGEHRRRDGYLRAGHVVAPAVGPTLGGYLVEYVDWRLIFYINVPVGILGAPLAAMVLPSRSRSAGRSSTWGFLTVGYGLFALLLACAEGQNWGWTGYRILGLFVTGTLSSRCSW
jgi:predicted MFS family arabinose efflux permease